MPKRPQPRRIAVASREAAGVTGATTIILEHSRRLAAAGWEVHIYGEKLDAGRITAAGARPHFIGRWRFASRFKRRLFAWRFERALRRGGRFDLVWGHGDTLTQDVLSFHNCVHAAHQAVHQRPLPPGSGVGRIHERVLTENKFRLLIANSHLMKREFASRFSVPEKKMRVVHPGYNADRFKVEDREKLGAGRRRELGVKPEEILVGLITSGDFGKRGVKLFIEALGRLSAAAKKDLRVIIVGRESRLGPYQELARAAGLGGRIRFLPPDPAVERYYHALDLYVHPALFEEFGLSVQEAMACGVAVLTSRRVGAAEVLQGEAGEMVLAAPETEALAGAMQRLITDKALRRRWGVMGANACRGNTWDKYFRETMAHCESLVLADF